jgi:hypothetical protein
LCGFIEVIGFRGIKMTIDESKWFVVALLYESVHEGEPKIVDENYDSTI